MSDQKHERPPAAAAADKMLEGFMAVDGGEAPNVGIVLVVSGAALVAIASIIVAWLKWRHPPKDG